MLIALVGKPSAGKSTLFNAMTLQNVPMAAYPFTTIDPHKAVAYVRVDCVDTEFNTQCHPRTGSCKNHKRFVPVDVIDVAGLVPGASEGKGRGNAFLNDISRASAIIHVVDVSGSTNELGEPVPPGSHDPAKDISFLENELNLWFLSVMKKNFTRFAKIPARSTSEKVKLTAQYLGGLGVNEHQIEQVGTKLNLWEKPLKLWSPGELESFSNTLRRRSKPIMIAANKADTPHAKENIRNLKKAFPDRAIVPCSAISELTLKRADTDKKIEYLPGDNSFNILTDLSPEQKKGLQYIQTSVLDVFHSTGVQEVLESCVFSLLNYLAIFPGGLKNLADKDGNVLPDCFLLPPNSTALDFAFYLHTDIGTNFIKAIDVKTKMLVGKDHELKNRDVIEIIFNK